MIINKLISTHGFQINRNKNNMASQTTKHDIFEFSKNSVLKRDLVNFRGASSSQINVDDLIAKLKNEDNRENTAEQLANIKDPKLQKEVVEKLTGNKNGLEHPYIQVIRLSAEVLGNIGVATDDQKLVKQIITALTKKGQGIHSCYQIIANASKEALEKLKNKKGNLNFENTTISEEITKVLEQAEVGEQNFYNGKKILSKE